MQKFLQSGWAAQGFKAKKRHQADAKQKKLSQPIKNQTSRRPAGLSQPIKN
ncbi:MAG: hypothetical protein SO039_07495 [Campylobacter sp.]|nr:hypothetical protein [Campylobacter sp.]